jgi:hypothetical protein
MSLSKPIYDLVSWLAEPALEHLTALAADLLTAGNKHDATTALEAARRRAIRQTVRGMYRTKGIPTGKGTSKPIPKQLLDLWEFLPTAGQDQLTQFARDLMNLGSEAEAAAALERAKKVARSTLPPWRNPDAVAGESTDEPDAKPTPTPA